MVEKHTSSDSTTNSKQLNLLASQPAMEMLRASGNKLAGHSSLGPLVVCTRIAGGIICGFLALT
jgi:hypothetical protein